MKQVLLSASFVLGALMLAGASHAIAALPPDFHDVPLDTVTQSMVDFAAKGMGPRTITQYNGADGALAAGSFSTQSMGDVAHIGLQMNAFAQVEKDMALQNMSPRDLTIFNVGGSKITLYGAIWTHSPHSTSFVYHLTQAQFDANWQEWVVQKGYRIISHAEWHEFGVPFYAAVFVKDNRPFIFNYGQNQAQFQQSNVDLGPQGFVINKMNVTDGPNGNLFSGIWLKTTQAVTFFYNMTSDGYQQTYNQVEGQGFRLTQLLGYGPQGGEFAAIWAK